MSDRSKTGELGRTDDWLLDFKRSRIRIPSCHGAHLNNCARRAYFAAPDRWHLSLLRSVAGRIESLAKAPADILASRGSYCRDKRIREIATILGETRLRLKHAV